MAVNLRILFATVFLLSLAATNAPVQADVTTSGSVLNNPPAGGGTLQNTEVVVGDADDNVSSLIGTMRIDSGTTLLLDRLIIGDEQQYIGDVVVTGAGTMLEMDSSFVSNPALQVGHEGTGYLTISDQAVVTVSNSNGNLAIGRDATSAGFVHVDGLLTQLSFGEDLIVGSSGYGELKLTAGALLYTLDLPGSTATIGAAAGGVGHVVVEGAHTLWKLPETVTIGVTGSGTLRIADDAVVDGNDGRAPGITVGRQGTVELAGGRLLSDTLTINGRLAGNGLVTGSVTVGATGEVGAGPGEMLRFTGAVSNAGVVNVAGSGAARAEVEFVGSVANNGGSPLPGRIAVADGAVRFTQPLTNSGTLASTAGITQFHGDITNANSGVITIDGKSSATFYGDVDVSLGALDIAAGSTALFLGDVNIAGNASLAITLGETDPDKSFATPLQVAGKTTLNTPISLQLAGGYLPNAGDSFELITAAGGLSIGTTDTTNFAPLPSGLAWDLVTLELGLLAQVIASGIDGDFNADNAVDAADYTVWRDNLGAAAGTLPNDSTGVAIGAAQYELWRNNFGATAAAASLSGAAVPEPGGAAILIAASIAGLVRTGARRYLVCSSKLSA